jgi:hypothetical protein
VSEKKRMNILPEEADTTGGRVSPDKLSCRKYKLGTKTDYFYEFSEMTTVVFYKKFRALKAMSVRVLQVFGPNKKSMLSLTSSDGQVTS